MKIPMTVVSVRTATPDELNSQEGRFPKMLSFPDVGAVVTMRCDNLSPVPPAMLTFPIRIDAAPKLGDKFEVIINQMPRDE